MDTPIRKPKVKSAWPPCIQCREPIAAASANEPAAVKNILLRRIIQPSKISAALLRAHTNTRAYLFTSGSRGPAPHNLTPLGAALGFQLGEQLLDAIFLFERGQAIVDVVAGDF